MAAQKKEHNKLNHQMTYRDYTWVTSE